LAACELDPAAEVFNQQFRIVFESVLIFKSEKVSMKIWISQKFEELVTWSSTTAWQQAGGAEQQGPLPIRGGSGTSVCEAFPHPS